MKLYVAEATPIQREMIKHLGLVEEYDDADTLLVLPGGLESLYTLLRGINDGKEIFLYNQDDFYTIIIKKFYQMYEEGKKKQMPSEYMTIEGNFDEIVQRMEEKKNEKPKHGKVSQLL